LNEISQIFLKRWQTGAQHLRRSGETCAPEGEDLGLLPEPKEELDDPEWEIAKLKEEIRALRLKAVSLGRPAAEVGVWPRPSTLRDSGRRHLRFRILASGSSTANDAHEAIQSQEMDFIPIISSTNRGN
jgi:hypothetical protein